MRIGFFTDSYFPRKDGVSYTIKTWKNNLEGKGHEVYVFYPESDNYTPDKNEIPVSSVNDPFYQGHNLAGPVRPDKIPDLDIIHCHTPGPICFSARALGKKENINSVYTHHTPLEDYIPHLFRLNSISKALKFLYLKMDNFYLRSFDAVTANTTMKNRFVEFKELPVGIDTEFFKPEKCDIADEWDLSRPLAGYSGRMSEEKNIGELLKFAEKFEGTLLLVGEGRHRSELEEKAPENVVFKDFLPREKLPEFYSSIDVFLTASTGDTLGISPLEANACGTPVVAADVHPFHENITQENGLRYEKGNIEDLVEKVEQVLGQDFDTRSAVKPYSLEKTVEKLEEMYEGLIDADR